MVAKERKIAVHMDPAKHVTGLHTANKLITMPLLRASMCRASAGLYFREDTAGTVLQQQNVDCAILRNVQSTRACTWARSNYYF